MIRRHDVMTSVDIGSDRICACVTRFHRASSSENDFEVAGIGMEPGDAVGEGGVKDLDALSAAVHSAAWG